MKKPKTDWKSRIGLGFLLNAGIAVVFILSAVFLLKYLKEHEQQLALMEAEVKAKLFLDHNLAIHTYFTHQLRPAISSLTDGYLSENYFDPVWMSSTFAVREIDMYYRSLEQKDYYYKECAIDARSLENEADPYERCFIEEINVDPNLKYRSLVRNLNGKKYFQVLRRGEVMEEACLRCHSTPENAPKRLIDLYGKERSFDRSKGEVVSAISIRIPLSDAFMRAEESSQKLTFVFFLVLLCIFFVQYLVYRHFIGRPINRMHQQALRIMEDDFHLGEKIELPPGRELHGLAGTLNAMSGRLKEHIEQLEDMVDGRTIELKRTNDKLKAEIEERTRANTELQEAMSKVKLLSGLLPICSSCKKIRDSRGYWNQVESYIQEHSEAQFSHGLCEECEEKLYGQNDWYKDIKEARNKKKDEED